MENSNKPELLKVFRLDVTVCMPEWDQCLMKTEIQLFVSLGSDLSSNFYTTSIRHSSLVTQMVCLTV